LGYLRLELNVSLNLAENYHPAGEMKIGRWYCFVYTPLSRKSLADRGIEVHIGTRNNRLFLEEFQLNVIKLKEYYYES